MARERERCEALERLYATKSELEMLAHRLPLTEGTLDFRNSILGAIGSVNRVIVMAERDEKLREALLYAE